MTAAAPTTDSLIAPCELARRAGVTNQAISYAMRKTLKVATVGRKLIENHPLVLAYIAKHHARPSHVKGKRGQPSPHEWKHNTHNPVIAPTTPPVSVEPEPQHVTMEDPLA